jgi:hypothetical protein
MEKWPKLCVFEKTSAQESNQTEDGAQCDHCSDSIYGSTSYFGRPKMSLTLSKVSESPVFCTAVHHPPAIIKVKHKAHLGQVITDFHAWKTID